MGETLAKNNAKELAKKGRKAPLYDPAFRRVDININGTLVLSLVGG
jgi:hypothetical protein